MSTIVDGPGNSVAATIVESRWGSGLTAVLVAVLLAGLIAPRSFTFSVIILICVLLLSARSRRLKISIGPDLRAIFGALAAFFGFAVLSIIWSEAPAQTALKSLTVGAVALATTMVAGYMAAETSSTVAQQLARGLLGALLFGALFLAIDTASSARLQMLIIDTLHLPERLFKGYYVWQDGKIFVIENVWINRSLCVLVILMWPAALAARSALSGKANVIAHGVLLLSSIIAVFGSGSETAKLALIIGAVVMGSAWLSTKWATYAVMAGWCMACMLVVPMALAAHDHAQRQTEWLGALSGASPKVRINIAYEYAKRYKETPLLGRGANASYVIGPLIDAKRNSMTDPPDHAMGQHPHNAFLQIWFELGAIGAIAFLALGLILIRATRMLDEATKPYAIAMFSAVACVLAPAYGFWQPWLDGLIAVSGISLAIALSAWRLWRARTVCHEPN